MTADGLPSRQRALAMLVISAGIVMAVLDGSIANIALPTIAHALHTTPALSVWIVNAYQLAVVATLLPVAALGEIVGYRRVYRWGVGVFAAGSLLCALSPTLGALAASRVLQGLGAAGLMGVNGALVRFTFPRAQLGRAIGITGMVVSTASALGPGIASLILWLGTWPMLFAINVPLGLLILAASGRLPASPLATHRLDVVSAVLNALMFAGFFAGAQTIVHGGRVLGAALLLGAGVAGGAVVWRERRSIRPLIPIDLLARPVLALSVSASVCAFAATTIALVTLPFFLEGTMHRSAAATGLLMTAWPAAIASVALLSGRLSERVSPALLGVVGMVAMAAGLLLLAALGPHASTGRVVAPIVLAGLGMGLFQTPNNKVMMSASPRERAGAASGMLATARLTGMATGATGAALVLHAAPTGANAAGCAAASGLALAAAALSAFRHGRTVVPGHVAEAV